MCLTCRLIKEAVAEINSVAASVVAVPLVAHFQIQVITLSLKVSARLGVALPHGGDRHKAVAVINACRHLNILPFKYNWLCSVFSRACNRLADKLSYIKALRLATVLYDSGRLQGAASGLVVGEIDRGFKLFDGVHPLHFPRHAGLSL